MKEDRDNLSDELLAAFLHGNAGENATDSVLAELDNNAQLSEIMNIYTSVDNNLENEELKVLPIFALAATHPESLFSFECEAFVLHHHDIPIDDFLQLEEAKADNWLCGGGNPLCHVGKLLELKGMAVSRQHDASIADLEKALDTGFEVITVVDENVLNGQTGAFKPKFHAIYMTWAEAEADDIEYLNLETLLDERLSIEEFGKAWACSGNYMITIRENADVYNPAPINVDYNQADKIENVSDSELS